MDFADFDIEHHEIDILVGQSEAEKSIKMSKQLFNDIMASLQEHRDAQHSRLT